MRLNRYPYELTEQEDPPPHRGDHGASSLRPLATDLGPPRPVGSRGRWPLFFVGVLLGVTGAISVTTWAVRTHRWQLGAPEVHSSAAAAPVESCPSAVPPPVCPPPPAADVSEACSPAAADARGAVEGAAKGKKTKKKPHHFARNAAAAPEQSAEPPGPPPEVQAETELSNWLK